MDEGSAGRRDQSSSLDFGLWDEANSWSSRPKFYLLHFAWVVDDAKCIVVTRVCVCVCVSVCLSVRGRTPTLLHGPGVIGGMVEAAA